MTNKTLFKFLPSSDKGATFTFVDLCAGIGGMRIAFEGLGGQCVFSSEWDKFCQQTYCENFGDMPDGDITKVPLSRIPNHDILLAGFPCQPFSKGGIATRKNLKMKIGFKDKVQGKIFFRILEILNKRKPKAFLLENVPQLLKIDGGKAFEVIKANLESLGYSVHYRCISSEDLVPQRRTRLYIVGVLGSTEFVFPEIPKLNPKLCYILEKKYDRKYILSDQLWKWLRNHAKKHKSSGNGFGFRLANASETACTLSARYGKDGSEILIPRKNGNPRKLTPRECARLMGFPEEFRIPVSDTQAYKQFGNSVVVPLIFLLGSSIIKKIASHESQVRLQITA